MIHRLPRRKLLAVTYQINELTNQQKSLCETLNQVQGDELNS